MKTLTDYLEALAAESRIPTQRPLTRIAYLLEAMGLQRVAPVVIVVVGTNGKGSVVRLLESIYLAAGYRVAAITSPHLLTFNERLRYQGASVSSERLLASFRQMAEYRDPKRPFNFYDVFTIALLDALQGLQPEIAVIEAGMGGRLDLVNLLSRDAVVLTSIALDHQAFLGDTRAAIAAEKAAVFRKGCPAICGASDAPTVVSQTALRCGAAYFEIDHDFSYVKYPKSWSFSSAVASYPDLPLSRLHCQNAATAVMTVTALQTRCPVLPKALYAGLLKTALSGRFERLCESPLLIVDVAHNPEATTWLASQLCQYRNRRIVAVVGMLAGKAIRESLSPLMSLVSSWYCVNLDMPRGVINQELSMECRALGAKSCYNFENVFAALEESWGQGGVKAQEVTVVFGSFYTVAAAKEAFRRMTS